MYSDVMLDTFKDDFMKELKIS